MEAMLRYDTFLRGVVYVIPDCSDSSERVKNGQNP